MVWIKVSNFINNASLRIHGSSQLKDYVTLRLLQMNPTKMSPRANQITIREFIPGKEPKQH